LKKQSGKVLKTPIFLHLISQIKRPFKGYEVARQTGLTTLSSLKCELGTLKNITAWLRVFGMINIAPGFMNTPSVINGFSDLIIEVFGKEIGNHKRSAVGMAELPFGAAVEIETEVEIST